jgi:hypothetical protein
MEIDQMEASAEVREEDALQLQLHALLGFRSTPARPGTNCSNLTRRCLPAGTWVPST